MWNIPTMVVHVPGVATGISCLRIFTSNILIFESMSYLKLLMLLFNILVEIASHMMWVLVWQSDALVPFWSFGAKKISVNLRFDNFFNLLSFWSHMDLFVEERMLWVVVHLSIFNASDSLPHFIETSGSELTSAQNVLPSTSHDWSMASHSWWQVSLFFLLQADKEMSLLLKIKLKFGLTFRDLRRYWRIFYKNIFVCYLN